MYHNDVVFQEGVVTTCQSLCVHNAKENSQAAACSALAMPGTVCIGEVCPGPRSKCRIECCLVHYRERCQGDYSLLALDALRAYVKAHQHTFYMTPLDIESENLDSVSMVAGYSLPPSCTKFALVRRGV